MAQLLSLGQSNGQFDEATNALPSQTNAQALAYNKAYAKVVAMLGDSALWSVNLAEQAQALNMIIARAQQVRSFIYHLRRADFISAAKEIRASIIPKGVSKSKSMANNFLEFHFGWSPLLQDIYNSVEIFLDPKLPVVRPFKVRAAASAKGRIPPSSPFGVTWTTDEVIKVQLGGGMFISNPNLHLASQLGLANPLVVAWELVPFSFVADWFGNVGQVLSSYSDFYGVSLSRAYWSSYQVLKSKSRWYYGLESNYLWAQMDRYPVSDFPGPTVTIRPFHGLSPVRGITAISLLLQKMK